MALTMTETDPGAIFSRRVAAEVRATMARRRIKQKDLAAAMNMSPQAISRRLSGELPFDLDELAHVARLLGDDPGDLIARGQNLK
jgi:transcriptional regulator with XRE-family HTH domain